MREGDVRQRQERLRGQLAVIREEEAMATQIFRKPVTLSALHVEDEDESVVVLYVACDDGSMWTLDDSVRPGGWEELAPIPGSAGELKRDDA